MTQLILKSLDVEKLVSELYKLQTDELLSKFDHEINKAVKGYVLNSWYNHWSSILIEHIFKSHKNVLPTVGQIKNVDFFINNIPLTNGLRCARSSGLASIRLGHSSTFLVALKCYAFPYWATKNAVNLVRYAKFKNDIRCHPWRRKRLTRFYEYGKNNTVKITMLCNFYTEVCELIQKFMVLFR